MVKKKNLPVSAGDAGSVPGSGRSTGEGNGKPLLLHGNPMDRRSLGGYSPWDCKSQT